MTEQPELEFVNDWSELEAAIAELSAWFFESNGTEHPYLDITPYDEPQAWHAVSVIRDYVPRLLTQYANLVELSFALTEGWETYATLNAPSGLYLPDNS